MAVNHEFKIVRGDTFSFDVVFSEVEVDKIDSLYFSVKRRVLDKECLFQKSFDNGIVTTDTFAYRVRVAPEDTKNVIPGTYVYDLQVGIAEDVYTILEGPFSITPDVTTDRRG